MPATLVRSITTYTDYDIWKIIPLNNTWNHSTWNGRIYFENKRQNALINAFVIHIRISKQVDMWYFFVFIILVLVFMNQLSFMLYYLFLMNSSRSNCHVFENWVFIIAGGAANLTVLIARDIFISDIKVSYHVSKFVINCFLYINRECDNFLYSIIICVTSYANWTHLILLSICW